MKVDDVLQCSFSSWYGQYPTIESIVLPLPDDVVRFLLMDGIFFGGCGSHDEDMETASCSKESCTGDTVTLETLNEEFKVLVNRSIYQLGGEVFPKLNWSSPRDAAWITAHNMLKCTNADEVFLLLKSSDFIMHDLTEPFLECEDAPGGPSSVQYTLVLRKWMDMAQRNEFRCFVKNKELIAISHRHTDCYSYRSLSDDADDYRAQFKTRLWSFFQANVKSKFSSLKYTFDVYVDDERILLLDFNPWSFVTNSLLFSWNELDNMFNTALHSTVGEATATTGALVPELRVILEDEIIQPPCLYSGLHGLPLEYHRLAMDAEQGQQPYEALLNLMQNQRLSDDEEMENQ